MREELSLVAVLLLLFLADLFMSPDAHKQKGTRPVLNTMLPVILMAIHTAINLVPSTAADIFGGMYHYVPGCQINPEHRHADCFSDGTRMDETRRYFIQAR